MVARLVFFAVLAGVLAEQPKVTQIQKVIQLLNGMVEKEKHEEQVQFAALQAFGVWYH